MVVAVEENCNTTGFRLRESQHNRKTTLRIHLRWSFFPAQFFSARYPGSSDSDFRFDSSARLSGLELEAEDVEGVGPLLLADEGHPVRTRVCRIPLLNQGRRKRVWSPPIDPNTQNNIKMFSYFICFQSLVEMEVENDLQDNHFWVQYIKKNITYEHYVL